MEGEPNIESAMPESYDDKWYRRFKEVGVFEDIEYMRGDTNKRKEIKRRFLAGEIENPQFDYPKFDDDQFINRSEVLLDLKDEILSDQGTPDWVKQVYQWRINEKIAEIRMLSMSKQASLTEDREAKLRFMKRFQRYSNFIYGKPDHDVYLYTLKKISERLQAAAMSDNEELQRLANKLLSQLPSLGDQVSDITEPSDEALRVAMENTQQEGIDMAEIRTESAEPLTAPEIQAVFNEALNNLQAEGWQTAIVEDTKSLEVSQEKQIVAIPSTKKMVAEELKALVAHEVGTHVARRLNGERSKLNLLGLGLDRYLRGEEGVSTMREQAVMGNVDSYAGEAGSLALSLAMGLDGEPRDFRQVYEIFYNLIKFDSIQTGKELSDEDIADKTWTRCYRTFRGTTCDIPGICMTRDIVYREGNIGVWDVIGKDPKQIMKFSIGKYDPDNPRHCWVLSQLGITDSDLEELNQEPESGA